MVWLTVIAAAIAGFVAGYITKQMQNKAKAESVEKLAEQTLKAAKRDAEALKKEIRIQAKADAIKAREEFEQATASKRRELSELEERITQREINLDRKVSMLDKKESVLEQKVAACDRRAAELENMHARLNRTIQKTETRLEKIAAMSREEARQTLLSQVEKEVHNEIGAMIRRKQEEARETCERESHKIIALAIQRYATSHAGEMMASSVDLPSDDIKGRIIGREGRNIRSLEAATGVNILIDDTPEAVVISGFDPVRREIARQSLEKLIADGRIHPARIEEVVSKVTENMDETIRKAGEEAIYSVGISDVAPELIRKLGRLKFRTSYTQNVLQHSIEVAELMGVMAGELNVDVGIAKRIGLFHDIGKALDHEVEGGHAIIGADLLKRHGENHIVVNAVAAHHEEVEAGSVYAHLCAAADAISSSRAGARSETTEIYIKRLEKLEAIADSFEGVKKSYAIQAGREVRILVDPDSVDDNNAMLLARNVSKKIESELQYPGQIKIIVIRETRSIEYAR